MTTTTKSTTTAPSLEIARAADGRIDVSQWERHCIAEFWRRKRDHSKSYLAASERKRTNPAQSADGRVPHDRYLDNAKFFRADTTLKLCYKDNSERTKTNAGWIEDGYSKWLCKMLKTDPELGEYMNEYLQNNIPGHGISISEKPDGFYKFLIMMTPKIPSLRTVFHEFAPEIKSGSYSSNALKRRYDFASSVFIFAMYFMSGTWNDAVHSMMLDALAADKPETVVAALEETILMSDDIRIFSGRMRLLEEIAQAKALPRFKDVKKQDTLFKAFASLQLQSMRRQMDKAEYRKAVEGLRSQFSDLWDELAAALDGQNEGPVLDVDAMIDRIEDDEPQSELNEAVKKRNQRYGEEMRSLRKEIKVTRRELDEMNSRREFLEDAINRKTEELEDLGRKMEALQVTLVSVHESEENGKAPEETISTDDADKLLYTPEDHIQEIWDALDTNQKAFLVLMHDFYTGNERDGLYTAFKEATGIHYARDIVVKIIIRLIVQILAETEIHPINAGNHEMIFEEEMRPIIEQNNLMHDLMITLGTLISKSRKLLKGDEEGASKIAKDVNKIVEKVAEIM